MINSDKVISKLRQVAFKSNMRHKHAAAIIDTKGNAIAFSYNTPNKAIKGSTHAEIACINKYLHSYVPRGHKIDYLIVIRINPKGKLVNSKPCNNCTKTLKNLGIDVVHS